MTRSVFVINAGSSSLKYQLVDVDSGAALASGLIERIGETSSDAKHEVPGREAVVERRMIPDHEKAFGWVLHQFTEHGPDLDAARLLGIGHRVVQGGARFDRAVRIDDDVAQQIDDLAPLAPLHNPANLQGIRSARATFAGYPHVAVFDTAFHLTIPPAAHRYAIEARIAAEHRVRKYGFHGTSHQFVSRRLAELLERPLADVNSIVLHLGNGASATAVRGGRSVETSMGMTPLAGLVMGTRSGDIDPGVVFHLHRVAGLSVDEIDTLLNKRSGLLGLTGTGDMRDVLQAAEAGIPRAVEALEIVGHRLRGTVGAYLAHLGRTDAIAFTAGIGENAARVREVALEGLEGLGIVLDPERNAGRGERRISADGSPIEVWVVPTNEELEIARQVAALVEP
ncbi:acetate/propionate family kinase [Agrococcus sp. TF02-05]|uniref:acetate/propionate family kinase n=1 Tax=Agrococcus sp. TF02-05 TaxID=2815211 RepID=UPI001AA11732|nr:acetate kinase [Agrococcus sp. TF02-05]MBO1770319.1 acetate kinase [Agrococcus sp. TF02-05]